MLERSFKYLKRLFCLLLCSFFFCSIALAEGGSDDMKEMFQGFWQPGDYGTRIEITGDQFMVLWRNRPVLVTTFSVKKEKDDYVAQLKETGLRYEGAASDYATVTDCRLKDGKMYLSKLFPISGPSDEVLSKTTNSRYGNVTVITEEMMPYLSGLWKTANGNYEMKIEKGMLTWRYKGSKWEEPEAIAVVRPNYKLDPNEFSIVNKDPANDFVCHLMEFRHVNGKLITHMLIHDATAPDIIFEKTK